MTEGSDEAWNGFVSELIETIAVEGVTTATFGKFLTQRSVFMQSRGVAYSKRRTSNGQAITLERVTYEGGEGDEGYSYA